MLVRVELDRYALHPSLSHYLAISLDLFAPLYCSGSYPDLFLVI